MLSFCGAYLSLGCPGRLGLLVLEVRPTRLAVAVEVAHCVLFVREAALWGRCCRRLPQKRVPRLVRPDGVYHGGAVNGDLVILHHSSGLWYSEHGVQGGRACVVSRGRNVADHVVSGRLCKKTVIFLAGPKFVIRHVWRRARYAWRSSCIGPAASAGHGSRALGFAPGSLGTSEASRPAFVAPQRARGPAVSCALWASPSVWGSCGSRVSVPRATAESPAVSWVPSVAFFRHRAPPGLGRVHWASPQARLVRVGLTALRSLHGNEMTPSSRASSGLHVLGLRLFSHRAPQAWGACAGVHPGRA